MGSCFLISLSGNVASFTGILPELHVEYVQPKCRNKLRRKKPHMYT